MNWYKISQQHPTYQQYTSRPESMIYPTDTKGNYLHEQIAFALGMYGNQIDPRVHDTPVKKTFAEANPNEPTIVLENVNSQVWTDQIVFDVAYDNQLYQIKIQNQDMSQSNFLTASGEVFYNDERIGVISGKGAAGIIKEIKIKMPQIHENLIAKQQNNEQIDDMANYYKTDQQNNPLGYDYK